MQREVFIKRLSSRIFGVRVERMQEKYTVCRHFTLLMRYIAISIANPQYTFSPHGDTRPVQDGTMNLF